MKTETLIRLPGHWISDVRPTSASRRQSRHCSLAYNFFRIRASCAPNSSAPDPSAAEYFRRDSACNPRRQSTTDAQSARAGKIRDGGRKCLARSRRPREMERNQSLHHFFLAHCCLTNGVGPAADRPIQASRESLQGFLRYAGTGIGPMSPPSKAAEKNLTSAGCRYTVRPEEIRYAKVFVTSEIIALYQCR
jgi:hypothetical protein